VDFDNELVHFSRSKAKGELADRVIFLTDKAAEILRTSFDREGPLFVNTKGKPWTKDSIGCRFKRLKKKLGKAMCAYASPMHLSDETQVLGEVASTIRYGNIQIMMSKVKIRKQPNTLSSRPADRLRFWRAIPCRQVSNESRCFPVISQPMK
jgi:hypothetical protein